MTIYDSEDLLRLLQTFWPIEWSPRMSQRQQDSTQQELYRMFKEYEAEEVSDVVRALARKVDRPPSYRQIIQEVLSSRGSSQNGLDFRWEQYIYYWAVDEYGREYVKDCNLKVFNDGRIVAPPGVKLDERLLRRQGIIGPSGAVAPLDDTLPPESDKFIPEFEGFQLMVEDW